MSLPLLRTVILVFALIVAAVPAGCSVPLYDESRSEWETDVTPVAVPGNESSSGGIGVNETGVTNPSLLAESHVAALVPPYVRNETWVMRAGDEELLRYEERIVVEQSGVAEIRIANGSATGVLLTDYRDATAYEEYRFNTRLQSGVDRAVDGEETNMSWWEASETSVSPMTSDDAVLLEAVFSFARTRANDSAPTDGYRLRGSTPTPGEPLVAPWLVAPKNASASAAVTDAGFVCSLEVRYEARYDGRFVIVSYRADYLRKAYGVESSPIEDCQ